MVGTTVAGRYIIQQQIGIGGMGIVYQASDPRLKRDVALKVVAPHLVANPDAREKFLREAETLAGLSHPNIVTVYDLAEDTDAGVVFIVMELLRGASLRVCLQQDSRPPFLSASQQICRALECAHARNVLHRDIKPENIFVCNSGLVKLMDFGLAGLLGPDRAHVSGALAGTFAYMAPEQLRNDPQDIRTDLYSLGLVLFEMLTGQTPFRADNPTELLSKRMNDPIPSVRTSQPALPERIDAVIQQLLQPNMANRFESATDLRHCLEQIQANRLVVDVPLKRADAPTAPRLSLSSTSNPSLPVVAPPTSRDPYTNNSSPPQRPAINVSTVATVGAFLVVGGGLLAYNYLGQRSQTPPPDTKPPVTRNHSTRPRPTSRRPRPAPIHRTRRPVTHATEPTGGHKVPHSGGAETAPKQPSGDVWTP